MSTSKLQHFLYMFESIRNLSGVHLRMCFWQMGMSVTHRMAPLASVSAPRNLRPPFVQYQLELAVRWDSLPLKWRMICGGSVASISLSSPRQVEAPCVPTRGDLQARN